MSSPIEAADTARPIRVAYRLTIDDVRRFVGAEDLRCWTCQVRSHKAASALLAGLVAGLSALCGLKLGLRSGFTVLGSATVLLAFFGWARGAFAGRRACRLSAELGLPQEIRVAISPLGIAKAAGPTLDEPGRRFPWSEVASVDAGPGLAVFRLRTAGAVLLVPDPAFPNAEAKQAFVEQARRWHHAALIDPRGED